MTGLAPQSPDTLVTNDTWSDLRKFRDLPEIDRDRLYDYRTARLREQMLEADVAALVMVNPVSLRYAVDYSTYALFQSRIPSTYLVMSVDGPTVIHGGYADGLSLVSRSEPARHISFFDSGDNLADNARLFADDLVRYLSEIGSDNRKVAIEYVNPSVTQACSQRGLQVVDGIAISEKARLIKSADEIECIKWAIAVAELGIAKMKDALSPGVTELQLWGLLNYTNLANHGEWHDGRMLASGPRINPWLQEATQRPVESGDLVGFDTDMVGPLGYFCDISRTFHCGPAKPSKRQKEIYRLGGPPPLGYDAVNKRLVPNQQEAETVRWLFAKFMELKSITQLKGEADRRGIVSKVRFRPGSGHQYGGKPISRGSLTLMLRNPIYIGKILHQGELYPGVHVAIVSPEIWQDVQRYLDVNGRRYVPGSADKVHRPLAGLVFDESGDRMNVVRVKKGASMFRYYVSNRLCRGPRTDDAALRVPASRLESAVLACIQSHLRSPSDLVEMHGLSDQPILSQRQVLDAASKVADLLGWKDNPQECPWGFIAKASARITVCQGHVVITMSLVGLLKALGAYEGLDSSALTPEQQIELKAPLFVAKRGQAARLMILNGDSPPEEKNQALIKLVAQAHHRFQLLATGKVSSPGEIAAQERTDPSELSRTLQLACLAPDIVQAILLGRQPADLTATKLKKLKNLPLCWQEQRLLLGFAG